MTITTKYDIGQEVYWADPWGRPVKEVVLKIQVSAKNTWYMFADDNNCEWWPESRLYPTREAALQSMEGEK